MSEQIIRIAGHCIAVDRLVGLPYNFNPFITDMDKSFLVISRISVGPVDCSSSLPKTKEKSYLDKSEELMAFKNEDGTYIAVVKVISTGRKYFLRASSNWNLVTLSPDCVSEDCPSSVINKFIMLTFIYASAFYKTVLMHASSIRIGLDALAFIGHSGAGKSTHSRLWLECFSDAELINDDQPAVRVFDDNTVKIYGTPWSGKTVCFKSVCAELKGIVRMKQADINKIEALSPVLLLGELLASCSMMKSDAATFRCIVSTVVKIASLVPGFVLENKPDKDAVLLVNNIVNLDKH